MNNEKKELWDALEEGYPQTGTRDTVPARMTLTEYQKQAMITRLQSCENWEYMFTGLVAEVGEIADIVAKAVRKDEAFIIDNKLAVENEEIGPKLIKELGDVLWFVAGLSDYLETDLEQVARINLEKLAERKRNNDIITHKDH